MSVLLPAKNCQLFSVLFNMGVFEPVHFDPAAAVLPSSGHPMLSLKANNY